MSRCFEHQSFEHDHSGELVKYLTGVNDVDKIL